MTADVTKPAGGGGGGGEKPAGRSGTLPQAIAHRGFSAAYPENTMEAFRGAFAAGAHAIETDVHLSRDKVLVPSHVGPFSQPALWSPPL